MLKNISKLESVVNEKMYQFLCDSDASLSDVKDALMRMCMYVQSIEDQIKEKMKQDKDLEKESSEEIDEKKE